LVCKGETLVWLIILPIAIGGVICYLYYFENYTFPYRELLFFSISIIISIFYSFIFLIYIKYLCLTTPFIDNEEFKKLIIYGMDRDRRRQTYSDLENIDPLH
jgi:Na+/H+ antiporter NhaC